MEAVKEIQSEEPNKADETKEIILCGMCGVSLSLKNNCNIIVFNKEMRTVCEECITKGCDSSPCFNCSKNAFFTFSMKFTINLQNHPSLPKTIFHFPGCSKDCTIAIQPAANLYVQETLGKDKSYVNANACKNCGKSDSTMARCSKCKLAWYCNAECQKANWPVHKPFCEHPSNNPQPW